MSSMSPSKAAAQATTSPAWQWKPPENGSSLPRTIRPIANGCCDLSSPAAASPDTPQARNEVVSQHPTSLRLEPGLRMKTRRDVHHLAFPRQFCLTNVSEPC